MNKEMRELLNLINEKKEKARALVVENKIGEAKELKNEIEALQEKYDLMNEFQQNNTSNFTNPATPEPKSNPASDFLNAVRNKFQNAMKEGTMADGGYTVPQDILTKINELKESKDALQSLVTVESVTTLSGSRVFKARAQQTGFAEVAEGGEITEKETPKFTQLPYQVKKYAGFFKVTNELLADSDQAIENTLVRWIGDESRVTRNKLILTELGKKAKTVITNLDDIKKILNVTLDPAFSNTTVVVTNQDGFNWLDTLKDLDNNYILQPDITRPGGKLLFGKPVHVVSNKDLPTSTGKVPIIIGDLKEGIVLFDRKQLSIRASNVAMDAYSTDTTLFRAIERQQVVTRDAEAFVYGEVEITTP